jgi:hypothetical protein
MTFGRSAIPFLLFAAAGCAAAYRFDVVARSSLSAGRPNAAEALHAELVIPAEPADAYVLDYEVRLPRAMELAFEIRCPGASRTGVLGETFEAYRTRRLAELEEERRRRAAAVGSLVGAVLPGMDARAGATAPGGSAEAQATVRPGEAAAQATLEALPPAALPPGDAGARTLRDEFALDGATYGACVFVLASNVPGQDVSGVAADLVLRRRIDVEAERAALAAADAEIRLRAGLDLRAALEIDLEEGGATRRTLDDRRRIGLDLRASLAADLVAGGADPGLRARERAEAERLTFEARAAAEAERTRAARERAEAERLAFEARAAVEAEARARLEAERLERARLEAEAIGIAWGVRTDLRASLIALGADPDLRRREFEENVRRNAGEAERLRLEREAALAIELEARREAERRYRRDAQAALEVRAALLGDLVGLGADPEWRLQGAPEPGGAEVAVDVRAERARLLAEWTAERDRAQAEWRNQEGYETAVEVRARLRADLHAAGAVDRPPRPAPRREERPPAPAEGAVWVPGEWTWSGLAWVWRDGRHELRGQATTWGIGDLGIGIEGGVTIEASPGGVEIRTGRP